MVGLTLKGNPAQIFEAKIKALSDSIYDKRAAMIQYAMAFGIELLTNDITASFGASFAEGITAEDLTSGKGNMHLVFTMPNLPRSMVTSSENRIIAAPSGKLLWIPISGFGYEGIQARAVWGGLFSAKYPRVQAGKPPLLFSKDTKTPAYFGIDHVTRKRGGMRNFDLNREKNLILQNMREAFAAG